MELASLTKFLTIIKILCYFLFIIAYFPAVILLEGGNDLDLTILDMPPEEGNRSRQNSESVAASTLTKRWNIFFVNYFCMPVVDHLNSTI